MKRLLLMTCAVTACFVASSAQGQVKSSVFDDVKVWYKGSAGNAVGTADSGGSDANPPPKNKMKSIPQFADSSSAMHGARMFWWGWRMQYQNQTVVCPYAGVTFDSTPCMVVPRAKCPVGSGYSEDPTGYVDVEINGVVTNQPYYVGARFGALYFDNWLSDWASDTVCSNYTVVLRFKSEAINPVSGNGNAILNFGYDWDATVGKATGFGLGWNTPNDLGTYAVPRFTVGQVTTDFSDCKVMNDHWVDCAIAVNGPNVDFWLCWNSGTDETPTNRLKKITRTYTRGGWPTVKCGSRAYLASNKNTWGTTYTNGVYSADTNAKGVFKGAFHQIAFWDRTLSGEEIREAFAGGTGRPDLVHVGLEGNGIEEFATSAQTASVSNTGAWENLNPTLTAANPTATIAFTCPALWAGKPQYLRVPMAASSSAGELSVALNGEALGSAIVKPGKVALFYVPESKIASGANTLVLTRTNGTALVLDAVTMGGSWQFGENINSFGYQSQVEDNPDRYVFTPACGSDEIHNRGTFSNGGERETSFCFFVPNDMVSKFHGVFTTRAQNTGWPTAAEMPYSFHVNGTKIGDYILKGGTETEVKVPDNAIIAGWNRAYWKTTSGGYWANIDWHKFEVLPPPQGMTLFIR